MERQLLQALPLIVAILLASGGLCLLLALVLLRRGRRGRDYQVRRRSWRRGGAFFVLGVLLLIAGVLTGVIGGAGTVAILVSQPTRSPDDLFGIVLSPEPLTQIAATHAAILRLTPSVSPTETPTIMPTPTLTSTSETPAVFATNTPLPPSATAWSVIALSPTFAQTPVAAAPNARIVIRALGNRATSDGQPDQSLTQFSARDRRVYVFITFTGMRAGTVWTRVLDYEGTPIDGRTELWRAGTEGSTSFWFAAPANGFASGRYTVRVLLNGREVDRVLLRVLPD